VALVPQPHTWLGALGCLFRQEVVHGTSAPGEQRDDVEALLFVQAVGVRDEAQPAAGVVALDDGVGAQRREPVHRVGEVPQPGARPGAVPADKRPLVADDEVPRGKVMMGDDLVAAGRREHLPACSLRRGEPGDSVMEGAGEAGGPAERRVAVQQVEAAGPGDRARGRT
jgi:hypothetical protein